MSKQISALMLSSDEGLWQMYYKILGPKNYLILLSSVKHVEQSKKAISEQELIILDIPNDKKEWIKTIKAVRSILGRQKPLLVISNIEGKSVAKVLNAGATDYMGRLENEEIIVAIVTNLTNRYRHSQKQ